MVDVQIQMAGSDDMAVPGLSALHVSVANNAYIISACIAGVPPRWTGPAGSVQPSETTDVPGFSRGI